MGNLIFSIDLSKIAIQTRFKKEKAYLFVSVNGLAAELGSHTLVGKPFFDLLRRNVYIFDLKNIK